MRMKRAGWLLGLLLLALPAGCAFVLDNSDGHPTHLGDPRENVRLLQEKLGYLREAESKLRDGISSTATDSERRDMEVRLLEARARRVDVQLELAHWQVLAKRMKKPEK